MSGSLSPVCSPSSHRVYLFRVHKGFRISKRVKETQGVSCDRPQSACGSALGSFGRCCYFLVVLILFSILNWRITALQCCVDVCRMTMQISHKYVYIYIYLCSLWSSKYIYNIIYIYNPRPRKPPSHAAPSSAPCY